MLPQYPNLCETAPRCITCGETAGRPKLSQTHVTYIVQRGEYCKIGLSAHITRRLAVLGSLRLGVRCPDDLDLSAPLILRKTFPGNREHETHNRFASSHVVGEWFLWESVREGLEQR